MKFHFYTRYFELYLCLGKLYDIREDDWHKQGGCVRIGCHIWNSNSGYKNTKKDMWKTRVGEPA